MLKRKFPEPEASGSPRAKRARQLDRDRESLQQRGHRVARSQVEGIPRAWRLQVFDRESLVEPGTQIVCVEERGSGWGRWARGGAANGWARSRTAKTSLY